MSQQADSDQAYVNKLLFSRKAGAPSGLAFWHTSHFQTCVMPGQVWGSRHQTPWWTDLLLSGG